MDIYNLWCTGATKYFFLMPKQNIPGLDEFIDAIKNNEVTFYIEKGKHDADMVEGYAGDYYSDKFITMLEENGGHNFDKWLLNIDDTGYEVQNKYYHIELKSEIPRIDGSIYRHPEIQAEIEEFCKKNNTLPSFISDNVLQQFINNYCQKNGVRKNDLLEISKGDTYGDFSKWDGSNIFTLADSRLLLVTDEIRKASKKMKLKNIEYDKLNRYEESKTNGV